MVLRLFYVPGRIPGKEAGMDVIVQLIQTVGFPIVCVLLCGWYIKYREDVNDAKLDKLSTAHHEEVRVLASAISDQKEAYIVQTAALTNAINLLTEKLEDMEVKT